MRILIVSHTCLIDVYQATFRDLERLGHTITVVTPRNWREVTEPERVVPRRLQGFHSTMVTMPVFMPGSYPLHGYIGRLSRVIERARPDVVYIDQEPYSISAFQWAIASARRHVPAIFYSAQNIAKRYPLPFMWSERAVWASCSGAVVVSRNVEAALRARGYEGRVHTIPLSVDSRMFEEAEVDRHLRAALGLRERVVAFVGRLVAEKGVGVLLDAYARLRERENTSLLVVGSGPLESRCRQVDGAVVVPSLPNTEVPRHLKLADILVLPSLTTPTWREQFGRVIIEALAAGVPVVGSDSGEIPHLIRDTGGGLTVREGDPDALGDAITRLLTDPDLHRHLAERSRMRVRTRYTTEVRAKALEAVLLEAAASRNAQVSSAVGAG